MMLLQIRVFDVSQVSAAMQRLEEIAEEAYQGTAASSNEAVMSDDCVIPQGASSEAPEDHIEGDCKPAIVLALHSSCVGSCVTHNVSLIVLASVRACLGTQGVIFWSCLCDSTLRLPASWCMLIVQQQQRLSHNIIIRCFL